MTNETLEYLLSTIGPRLTAVGIGVTDARQMIPWRDGTEAIPMEVAMRLNVTHRFVKTFMDSGDTAEVAAGYLRGSWPDLGDNAPVMVIREGGFDEWDRLLGIAERVARYGGGY